MRAALARAAGPTLVTAGAALLVAGAATYTRTPPAVPPDVGSVPSAAVPGAPVPVHIYPSRRPRALPAAVPVGVRLPGREPARVVRAGVAANGELGLPQDVDSVGWWSGGARPGQVRGSVVLAGHVDGAGQGTGVFAALRDLPVGARVVVTGADGRDRAYTVTGRRSHRKEALPPEVFSPDVPARLVLVTCTGAYDAATRSYRDNLVVYASPVV